MRYLFIALTVFIVSGCTIKQTVSINTYALDGSNTTTTYESTHKKLFINEPFIQGSFASKNIFYSQQAYQYDAYVKNRWMDFPSQMIQRQLERVISDSKLFEYQSIQHSKVSYDYQLNTTINSMYHLHQEGESYAVLKLTFEVIQNKQLIHTLTYDKQLLCEENTPYGYVKAINQLLLESETQLLEELAQQLTS